MRALEIKSEADKLEPDGESPVTIEDIEDFIKVKICTRLLIAG